MFRGCLSGIHLFTFGLFRNRLFTFCLFRFRLFTEFLTGAFLFREFLFVFVPGRGGGFHFLYFFPAQEFLHVENSLEDLHRTGRDIHIVLVWYCERFCKKTFFGLCVHKDLPDVISGQPGKGKRKLLPVHVDSQISESGKLTVFGLGVVFTVSYADTVAGGSEIRIPGFCAVKRDVSVAEIEVVNILKGLCPGKDRVVPAERYQLSGKFRKLIAFRGRCPVDPGGFIVLTVGIVVASLCVEALVSLQQHRGASGKHDKRQEVADLFSAEPQDLFILRFALFTAVPAEVLLAAVETEFAVFLVVAVIVGDEVCEGEPVTAGHIAQIRMILRSSEKELQEVGHHIIVALDESAEQGLELIAAGDEIGKADWSIHCGGSAPAGSSGADDQP